MLPAKPEMLTLTMFLFSQRILCRIKQILSVTKVLAMLINLPKIVLCDFQVWGCDYDRNKTPADLKRLAQAYAMLMSLEPRCPTPLRARNTPAKYLRAMRVSLVCHVCKDLQVLMCEGTKIANRKSSAIWHWHRHMAMKVR